MSPLPLSNFRLKHEISFDATATLKARPSFAPLIAEAITLWSEAEFMLGVALIQMLGARAEPAAAMYQALRSSAAQNAAITAVAAASLEGDALALFEAVTVLFRRDAWQRNSFAHGMIGHAVDLPDRLLIADPQDMHKHWLNMFVKQHLTTDKSKLVAASTRAFNNKVMVYKEADVSERIERFKILNKWVLDLAVIVSERHHDKARSLARLSNEPEIQKERSRRQKSRKNPP